MSLLSSFGDVTWYKRKRTANSVKADFPVTTADAVIVNEDGDDLTHYLPTVDNAASNPSTQVPLGVISSSTIEVTDTLAANLL